MDNIATNAKAARIETANEVLKSFAPGTSLRLSTTGHVLVEWANRTGAYSKRWMTRGQDFYPLWKRDWAHGGTACTALAQLVRWVQGKPVLGLSTWRYWAGDRCMLLRQQGDSGAAAIAALQAAGYPEEPACVLCGAQLNKETGCDWWSLEKVAGPCCGSHGGCRQKVRVA